MKIKDNYKVKFVDRGTEGRQSGMKIVCVSTAPERWKQMLDVSETIRVRGAVRPDPLQPPPSPLRQTWMDRKWCLAQNCPSHLRELTFGGSEKLQC